MRGPRRYVAIPLLLVGIAVVASCKPTVTLGPSSSGLYGTPGKEGKIGFAYGGLATVCNSLCPMMPGTTERIQLDPGQPLDAVFESSDPTIVAVAGGEELEAAADAAPQSIIGIHVTAVAPGTAEFRVKDAAGQIVDRIDLVVETPARVALQGYNADGGAPVETNAETLKVGDSIELVAAAFRADGTPIEAQAGWTFAGDAPAVAEVIDACQLVCLTGDDTLKVTGLAPGTAHATATGGGVTGSATLTVTN